jgi:carbon-monoxide dehydrogenase medium subunit
VKPVSFDYEKPNTLADASSLLINTNGQAKVLAGGQSLGPMMNLRLARPGLLVDITQIPELKQVTDTGEYLSIGACVTHADIEDCRISDVSNGMMTSVAAGIAYRAVRNRGTLGGSLVHADPAADWVSTLLLLNAKLEIFGPTGLRRLSINDFMRSAFETVMAEDEILVSIHIPKLSSVARWGYYKFCRKTGEFAHGMSAVLIDPERGINRVVIGATDTCPIVIEDATTLLSSSGDLDSNIDKTGLFGEGLLQQTHRVCLIRAINQVRLT